MSKKYKNIIEVVFDSELDQTGSTIYYKPGEDSYVNKAHQQFLDAINSPNLYSIELDDYYDYASDKEPKIVIRHIRKETEEEYTKRIAITKKRRESARKAAIKRRTNKEAEERALYEKLKEKYS